MRLYDTTMLSAAFMKYHMGDSLTDNEIVEIITFLEPMEIDGWVLDSRFQLFVTEIREITNRVRGYQNSRIMSGKWNPDKPRFLKEHDEK